MTLLPDSGGGNVGLVLLQVHDVGHPSGVEQLVHLHNDHNVDA